MKLPDLQLRTGRVVNIHTPCPSPAPCGVCKVLVSDSSATSHQFPPLGLDCGDLTADSKSFLNSFIKKSILVLKCRHFKHNIGLGEEGPLFPLLTRGWLTPFHLCFVTYSRALFLPFGPSLQGSLAGGVLHRVAPRRGFSPGPHDTPGSFSQPGEFFSQLSGCAGPTRLM